jgi:glycosyltransferase involved in cell wall biosynthesis
MAHNEAATIGAALRAIVEEPDGIVQVSSIVVVASGCTDGTEDVVRGIAAEDPRVRLLREQERSGKAAAINWFMRETTEPICVLVSGDVILTPGALTRLISPLEGETVGMTGGRPVPTNPRTGLVGNCVHLLWDLHDEVGRKSPKLGEVVAFRRLFDDIDASSLADEASIESIVLNAGLRLSYVPEAVARNRGPETVAEYVRQRRNNHIAHLRLEQRAGYRPATMGVIGILRAVRRVAHRRPDKRGYLAAVVALEAVARHWATLQFWFGLAPSGGTWRPIRSSKQVVAPGHVLRRYHETTVELRLVRARDLGAVSLRSPLRPEELARRLRTEDRIVVESDLVSAQLNTDQIGAAQAARRLASEAHGWILESLAAHSGPYAVDGG